MSTELAVVSKAGFGKPGYCKICASALLPQINKMIKEGQNAAKIGRWAKEFGLTFARQTLYAHKEHITDPKTSFVQQARRNPVVKNVSTRQFLEAIRDSAAAKAVADPDAVSIDHGLKAAQILSNDKKGAEGIKLILMSVMVGRADEVIEGEYTDVTGEVETDSE